MKLSLEQTGIFLSTFQPTAKFGFLGSGIESLPLCANRAVGNICSGQCCRPRKRVVPGEMTPKRDPSFEKDTSTAAYAISRRDVSTSKAQGQAGL